jgi:hypothetical protein
MKDKASGLPKKYVSGLSKSTAKARAAHWKEMEKYSDRDPRAYEPAPGDATAKTKPSKHTIKYKKMFGESAEAGLKDKAAKSGVSLSILRKVYRRGVAAWNSGHRPGTTPQQWGMARVNSYITKGKGTYHGADKDLREEEANEACWTGYKQVGLKKKGNKMVPNCVPESMSEEGGAGDEGTTKLLKKYKKDTPKGVQEAIIAADRVPEKYKDPVTGKIKIRMVPSNQKIESVMRFKQFIEEAVDCTCESVYEELEIVESEYQGKKVQLNNPFRTPGGPKKFSVYVKNDKGNVVKVNFGDPNMEIKRDDPSRRASFRARHNCDNAGPKWKARYWSCYQWRAGAKVDN